MTTSATSNPCDVLAVCYGGGHVNMIVPVVRELNRRLAPIDVTILGLTNAQPVLEAEGLPYIGFRHLPDAEVPEVQGYGRMLVERMEGATLDREESIAYLGASYRDLVAEHGDAEAERVYESVGRQSFLPVATLRRLIERLQPRLVIATSAPRTERAAIMAARETGTPAMCLVDLFASKEIAWLGEPGFADRICVNSEYVRDRVVSAGRDPASVSVTGNPAFDRLADPSLQRRAQALREQRGWREGCVVLFASQPEPPLHPVTGARADTELPHRVERELVALATRRPDVKIIVRRHPSQPPVDEPASLLPAEVSTSNDDLAVLLQAVDCVLTFSSTVGLEGLLVGRPLVALQLSVTSGMVPYPELPGTIPVADLDEIEHAIDRAVAMNPASTPGLPAAGGAAACVVDIARDILRPEDQAMMRPS